MSMYKKKTQNLPTMIIYPNLSIVPTDPTVSEKHEPHLQSFIHDKAPSHYLSNIECIPLFMQKRFMNFVFYKLKLDPVGKIRDNVYDPFASSQCADDIISLNFPHATSIHHMLGEVDPTEFFNSKNMDGTSPYCWRINDYMYWYGWFTHKQLRIPVHIFISHDSMMCFKGNYDVNGLNLYKLTYNEIKQQLEKRMHDFNVLWELFHEYKCHDLTGLLSYNHNVNNINDLKNLSVDDIEHFIAYIEKHITREVHIPGNGFYADPSTYDRVLTQETKDGFLRLMQICRLTEPKHDALLSLLDAAKEIDDKEKADANTRARVEALVADYTRLAARAVHDPKILPQASMHVFLGIPEQVLRNYMERGPDFVEPWHLTTINNRLDVVDTKRNNARRVREMLGGFKSYHDKRVATGQYVPDSWHKMLGIDEALLKDFLQGYRSFEYPKIYNALKELHDRRKQLQGNF